MIFTIAVISEILKNTYTFIDKKFSNWNSSINIMKWQRWQ